MKNFFFYIILYARNNAFVMQFIDPVSKRAKYFLIGCYVNLFKNKFYFYILGGKYVHVQENLVLHLQSRFLYFLCHR